MLSSPNSQKGLYPVMPILYPIQATDQIPVSVVVSVLLSLLFIGVSCLICLLVTHIMQKQNFQTHSPLQLILTGFFALALYLRFGCSMVAVQGMILFFILLYASCSDLTTHTMDDYLWEMVGILGLLSYYTVGLPSMLVGAVMVCVPQILIALLPPHKALGGADMKLSTALAFLLGWQKGLAALVLGLLLAVIVMLIIQHLNKKKKKQPFALIPFLSVGALVMFVI